VAAAAAAAKLLAALGAAGGAGIAPLLDVKEKSSGKRSHIAAAAAAASAAAAAAEELLAAGLGADMGMDMGVGKEAGAIAIGAKPRVLDGAPAELLAEELLQLLPTGEGLKGIEGDAAGIIGTLPATAGVVEKAAAAGQFDAERAAEEEVEAAAAQAKPWKLLFGFQDWEGIGVGGAVPVLGVAVNSCACGKFAKAPALDDDDAPNEEEKEVCMLLVGAAVEEGKDEAVGNLFQLPCLDML